MKTLLKYFSFILSVVILNSCEGRRDFPELVETGVLFESTDILLISGETDTIVPRFEPNIVPQRNYIYEVEDPSVADVEVIENQAALVTATGSGETTIRIVSQDNDELTAEARLKVIAGAPIDITDQATIAVNREYSGGRDGAEGSLKLVDGDPNSKYLSDYLQPFLINLEFEEAQLINFYQLTSGNDAPARDPLDWELQGSNDGENWETLDERSGQAFSGRNLTREFYFENETAYQYYRLNILNNNGGGLFQMSEWALLSIPE